MRVPLEWLKEFVDIRVKPDRLASMLTMSGLEVEEIERVGNDAIFELGVTPNRSDCLSIIGVAREVSAVLNKKLTPAAPRIPRGKGRMSDFMKISVRHGKRCPRYAARIIDGVKIGPSPSWIERRLAACGVRSINNVVDATNYVMIETGQPLHAFDVRFISGNRIDVREAGAEMNFTTLDGVEQKLSPDDLLICDGDGPVALAGVMGGANSEVRESTTRILLESAFFEPAGVRRTSRRLGLASESSRRFERGIDPNGAVSALQRITGIILETAGGTPTSDWIDIYSNRIKPRRLFITAEETNHILGTNLGLGEMAKILERLGLGVSRPRPKKLAVIVPTFRPDLERAIDIVEEVARLYGYGSIDETMPSVKMRPIVRPDYAKSEDTVRGTLVGAGLSEVALYGFTSEENLRPFAEIGGTFIKVTNPLSKDQSAMRTMLIPGLLDVVRFNASRQRSDCKLFALQKTFNRPKPVGPIMETRTVAGLLTGRRYPNAWEMAGETLDFYDAKGVVEGVLSSLKLSEDTIYQRGDAYGFLHPWRFAHVICAGKRIGFVGQLHPDTSSTWDLKQDVFVFEMDFGLLAEIARGEPSKFYELSKFPFVERDFALVLPNRIPAVEIERAVSDSGVDLVTGARIFDVYKGKGIEQGHRSLAVKIRFARSDRTLTDEEVGAAQEKILDSLKSKLGATLRM